jgi:hypothetical protein
MSGQVGQRGFGTGGRVGLLARMDLKLYCILALVAHSAT